MSRVERLREERAQHETWVTLRDLARFVFFLATELEITVATVEELQNAIALLQSDVATEIQNVKDQIAALQATPAGSITPDQLEPLKTAVDNIDAAIKSADPGAAPAAVPPADVPPADQPPPAA